MRSPIRSIRVPDEVWDEIGRRADLHGESRSAYLLRRALEDEGDLRSAASLLAEEMDRVSDRARKLAGRRARKR